MTTPNLILRSDLKFVSQPGRRCWRCVVEDPIHRKFFRIGRKEYLIASLLDGNRSQEEIQNILSARNENQSISAHRIQTTLRWLLANGLARHAVPSSPVEPPRSAAPTNLLPIGDPFGFRIPFLAGPAVEAFARRFVWFGSFHALVIGIFAILFAGITFAQSPSFFLDLGKSLFVPDSICWWMIAWLILKSVHELGHAVACIFYGGSIRNAGLAFFYFAPVPFVDTTDMWRLEKRLARLHCAAAGVYAEIVLASLALIVCNYTENSILQYLCISIVTLGTISTLAFNANPLARFDGYYFIADLLDRPSLWNEGRAAAGHLATLLTFGRVPPQKSGWLLLASYGVGCIAYRWCVMVGLAWGSWATWKGVGLLLIALACYFWFIAPRIKAFQVQGLLKWITLQGQIWSIPRVVACSLLVTLIALLAVFAPSPFQPLAPGIVCYENPVMIRTEVDGIVDQLFVADGQIVDSSQPLLSIANPKLQMSRENLQIELQLSEERARAKRVDGRMAEFQSEQAQIESLRTQLEQIDQKVAGTTPMSDTRGQFISRSFSNRLGQYVKPGDLLGTIVQPSLLEVQCSLAQVDVSLYRDYVGKTVWIRKEDGALMEGVLKEVMPRYSETLDHPSLAAKYDGPIAVRMESQQSEKDPLKTLKPRTVARVAIDPKDADKLQPGEHCSIELANERLTLLGVSLRWTQTLAEWLMPESES